jgi:hypothetical protein
MQKFKPAQPMNTDINKSMYIFFHELKRGKLAQVTTNNSISTRFGFYLINRQATLK